jgi:hypothetical protein
VLGQVAASRAMKRLASMTPVVNISVLLCSGGSHYYASRTLLLGRLEPLFYAVNLVFHVLFAVHAGPEPHVG